MNLLDLNAYFLIEPNWGYPVTVSHVWNTGIQRSVLGNEKRSIYYSRYRLRESFTFMPYDYARNAWANKNIALNQAKIWGVPLWPDIFVTTATIGPSVSVITLDTANRHWRDFGILIDPSDFSVYEAFEITSVDAGQLNTSTIAGTWPAGTLLFPLFAAKIQTTVPLEIITTSLSSVKIEAEETIKA